MVLVLLLILAFLGLAVLAELEAGKEPPAVSAVDCPGCGNSVEADWLVCPKCRRLLQESCAICDRPRDTWRPFCPWCGGRRGENLG
jgi:hypothetical protein